MRRNRISQRGLSFRSRREGRVSFWTEALIMAGYTAFAVAMAALVVYYMGYHTMLVDAAMGPENVRGQEVLVNRLVYRFSNPEPGDVIAFYPAGSRLQHPLVRRVVAVPGDTVEIRDNVLLINGIPYDLESNYGMIAYAGLAASPLQLKADEYFCLGDLMKEGEDSRHSTIGPVTEDSIIGKVWYAMHYRGEDGTVFAHFVR